MISEEPEHLLVFPIPMKGECWYSLLARYHAISGNHSEQYTFRQLFGGKTALNAAVTLPSRVQLIDSWLSRECGLTSERIIREFTAYQYLRLSSRFPDTAYQSLMQCRAKRGRSLRPQMIYALQGRRQKLCFCPDCVRSDTEEYRHSCWHLVHQLNGVRYCPIHGTRLIESPWPENGKLMHFYPAPDTEAAERMEKENKSREEKTDVFQDRFVELAGTINWLLANGERIGTEEKLVQLYESELGSNPSWDDILRRLAANEAGFVEELFPDEDLVCLARDVIRYGLRKQTPLFHALMIMRLGGVQWIKSKIQT